jgi:hypothetical protein
VPRRPVHPNAGAVARPDTARTERRALRRRAVGLSATLVAVLLVAACSPGDVAIDAPALDAEEKAACAELVDALPARLVDQERRGPDVAHGAAWGDPAVVLRCGVDEPAGFDELSTCQVVNDVAWFIPEEQVTGEPVDILMTTVGRRPNVEVALPAEYFPPAAAMAQLSEAISAHSTEVEPCG